MPPVRKGSRLQMKKKGSKRLRRAVNRIINGLAKAKEVTKPNRRRHDGRHWWVYDWEQQRWIIDA